MELTRKQKQAALRKRKARNIRELRARRANEGITEIRGVFALTDDHVELKKALRAMINQEIKEGNSE